MQTSQPRRGPSMMSSHGRAQRAARLAKEEGNFADFVFYTHAERALNFYLCRIPTPPDKWGDPICIDWTNN